jgi:hypothetical protein
VLQLCRSALISLADMVLAPAEAIRRELKSNGFRWSPTLGAWQRHRSNRATYLAKLMQTNRTP